MRQDDHIKNREGVKHKFREKGLELRIKPPLRRAPISQSGFETIGDKLIENS